MSHNILILGGAGFIGSAIAERFVSGGWRVSVIDGLLPRTGGRRENLKDILANITFIDLPLEEVQDLYKYLAASDLVVDCMGWTAHRLAIDDPYYDLALNVQSHLFLLSHLKAFPGKQVIYLGSRGQYGNPELDEITEEAPQVPEDVQGIHKLTAESHFRICASRDKLSIVSLRIPNCFGRHQPLAGDDVGLIGGFFNDIIAGKPIIIYGKERKRNVVYSSDVAEIIYRLSSCMNKLGAPFSAFNIAGFEVTIEELARLMIQVAGKGTVEIKDMSREIALRDIGNAHFNEQKLQRLLGSYRYTDLQEAFMQTYAYAIS